MKILLFGKNGQVGWELQRSLSCIGELVALDANSQDFCGDFSDIDGITATVERVAPDVIVNAVAYTAVDKAESDSDFARTVNALAPQALARVAALTGAVLVHYSTDYVFNGSGDVPWLETDITGALSVYGKTKLEGEDAIRASGCQHIILRTSWVYASRGKNFAKTMLKLAQERDSLTVVDDQIGAPTGADLLADVTANIIGVARRRPDVCGLYHVAASGETSWHGYATYVIDFARQAGIDVKVMSEAIKPVLSSAFPSPAKRPKNSRLNTQKLQNTFGVYLPHWQKGVARMLLEIIDKNNELP